MELVPTFFRTIRPFLPMTYAIDGLREILFGSYRDYLTQSIMILVCFLIVFIILSEILSNRLSKVTDELHQIT